MTRQAILIVIALFISQASETKENTQCGVKESCKVGRQGPVLHKNLPTKAVVSERNGNIWNNYKVKFPCTKHWKL